MTTENAVDLVEDGREGIRLFGVSQITKGGTEFIAFCRMLGLLIEKTSANTILLGFLTPWLDFGRLEPLC